MRSRKTTILLADDHLVVRMGLSAIIGIEEDLAVIGEAGDGKTAIELARSLKPDVVVMDLMMPHVGGADATAAILKDCPRTKILILTTFSDSEDVQRAFDAGATGAIVKDSSHAELLSAIRAVAEGKRVVSAEIATAMTLDEPKPNLSPRHVEVLHYAAKGLTNSDIANLLGIGIDCVKAHMKTIFSRLGASNRAEAVDIAHHKHLLDT